MVIMPGNWGQNTSNGYCNLMMLSISGQSVSVSCYLYCNKQSPDPFCLYNSVSDLASERRLIHSGKVV